LCYFDFFLCLLGLSIFYISINMVCHDLFLLYPDVCLSFLAVMHRLQLIHTDLKPENILLVSSDYVKLPYPKVFLVFTWLRLTIGKILEKNWPFSTWSHLIITIPSLPLLTSGKLTYSNCIWLLLVFLHLLGAVPTKAHKTHQFNLDFIVISLEYSSGLISYLHYKFSI
jgi:serine/threonine protein kinase